MYLQFLFILQKDIEDLSKVCEKRPGAMCNKICAERVVSKENLHLKFDDKKEWHKVFDVKGLKDILVNIKKQLYMLVAGNTAHGIYIYTYFKINIMRDNDIFM